MTTHLDAVNRACMAKELAVGALYLALREVVKTDPTPENYAVLRNTQMTVEALVETLTVEEPNL